MIAGAGEELGPDHVPGGVELRDDQIEVLRTTREREIAERQAAAQDGAQQDPSVRVGGEAESVVLGVDLEAHAPHRAWRRLSIGAGGLAAGPGAVAAVAPAARARGARARRCAARAAAAAADLDPTRAPRAHDNACQDARQDLRTLHRGLRALRPT